MRPLPLTQAMLHDHKAYVGKSGCPRADISIKRSLAPFPQLATADGHRISATPQHWQKPCHPFVGIMRRKRAYILDTALTIHTCVLFELIYVRVGDFLDFSGFFCRFSDFSAKMSRKSLPSLLRA